MCIHKHGHNLIVRKYACTHKHMAGNVCLHRGFLFKTNLIKQWHNCNRLSREVPDEKLTFNHIKKWVIIWARSHLFTRNDTLGQYIISMEEHWFLSFSFHSCTKSKITAQDHFLYIISYTLIPNMHAGEASSTCRFCKCILY